MSWFEYEMHPDDHTVFEGIARISDESFCHPWGTQKHYDVEITNFRVYAYLLDVRVDVTKSIRPDILEDFEGIFLDFVREKKMSEMIAG